MKDNLIKDLKDLFNELVDYRSRLLHHLNDASVTEELSDDAIEDLRQIRSSISYLEDRVCELKESIDQRVYCIEVTTTLATNIKVLAKNEDDAIELACEETERRFNRALREYDYSFYDNIGEMLGHESQADDEADMEYPYDE